jgi:hypothetical protein
MITLSVNSTTGSVEVSCLFDKDLNINENEERAFNIISSFLPSDLLEFISIERRSKDYISMFCGENDFLRLKYSDRSKWISLRLPADIAAKNIDNPLFAAQQNKNQFHWRAKLNSLDDLSLFKDFVVSSCVYIPE